MALRSYKSIFGISLLAGFLAIFGLAGYIHWSSTPPLRIWPVANEVSISTQITLTAIESLKQRGFATVIDLRPDGEASDQPFSSAVEAEAKGQGLNFFYVPVPHGDKVPAEVVERLTQALAVSGRPVLLYCRSGRRATRAWSLAEAGRSDGLSLEEIKTSARRTGHAIDDLIPAIKEKIDRRNPLIGKLP